MQVAYLNPSGNLGGAETSLRELLTSVRAAAPTWKLWLILAEDGPLAEIARDLGVNVVVQPFPRALARVGDAGGGGVAKVFSLLRAAAETARYAGSLTALLRKIQPDIVHTNGLKMHVLASWTRPAKVPLIWHIHDYVSRRPLARRLLRWRYKACTVAIANSRSVASDLRSLFPGLKVVPIYNAIDMQRFSPDGAKLDLDAMSGLEPAGDETVRVGLVGTFARWKGQEVFLEALARLSPSLPIRGYIIGGPIYATDGSQWSRAELERRADDLGLRGRVGFTGFLQDTAPALRSLDVVVHASTQPEPFGMVIIEGMASGKPVIASRAGGATELFVEGESALAHPTGDAPALAVEIERLVCDRKLRHRLGQAGKAAAEQLYHGKRLAEEVLALYTECAGGTTGGQMPVMFESRLPSGERANHV